jgi:hypothetical protein
MPSVLALALPLVLGLPHGRARLPAEVTPAASLLVAGPRAVLLFEEDMAAERIAVAVEAALVGEAVPRW